MIIEGHGKITFFHKAGDATQDPCQCADCGSFITQTTHHCFQVGLSAVDAAALIEDALAQPSTTKSDTELRRERSRRDVQEKRRELRRNKVRPR